MRNSIAFIMICAVPVFLIAQTQLDVQGSTSSSDTVAVIKVNYLGFNNVVGLKVVSNLGIGLGYGGYFIGGRVGVYGESEGHLGVYGKSITGEGVRGRSSFSTGVWGESDFSTGVYGYSTGSAGVYGESDTNTGVVGTSRTNSGMKGSSNTGFGVYGISSSSYGVYGQSTSDAGVLGTSTNGAGVHAYSENTVGVVGRSNNAGSWDFNAQGAGMNYGATSSRRWKHDIENISDPIAMISKLRGVYFNWDAEHGSQHDIGFIAEEIGVVLPEIVSYEENGTDATSMDYSKMTPLLVEAVNAMRKEYQEKFEKQQAQLDNLTHELQEIKILFMTSTTRKTGNE